MEATRSCFSFCIRFHFNGRTDRAIRDEEHRIQDMQEYHITDKEKGQRLDKYLHRQMPEAPSSFFYKMLRKKNITRNGKKAAGNELLEEGDRICLFLSDETFQKMGGILQNPAGKGMPQTAKQKNAEARRKTVEISAASAFGVSATPETVRRETERLREGERAFRSLSSRYPGLSIVYEDEDVAAAYKPAGVLSQKAAPEDLSLNEWFLGYLAGKGEVSTESLRRYVPSVQNRLDRNTEGLVLLAKTLPGSHFLTGLQREHLLGKFYLLIVWGNVGQSGTLEGYLEKNSASNQVRIFPNAGEGRVFAKTVYRPLSSGTLEKSPATLVEAELITGRTHQLRAQFAAMGHPIAGDPKYGDAARDLRLRKSGIRSQLLLCERVEFPELSGEFARLSHRIIRCERPPVYAGMEREAPVRSPKAARDLRSAERKNRNAANRTK